MSLFWYWWMTEVKCAVQRCSWESQVFKVDSFSSTFWTVWGNLRYRERAKKLLHRVYVDKNQEMKRITKVFFSHVNIQYLVSDCIRLDVVCCTSWNTTHTFVLKLIPFHCFLIWHQWIVVNKKKLFRFKRGKIFFYPYHFLGSISFFSQQSSLLIKKSASCVCKTSYLLKKVKMLASWLYYIFLVKRHKSLFDWTSLRTPISNYLFI